MSAPRHAVRRRWRRRTAVATMLFGVTTIGTGVAGITMAHAAPAAGSGLGPVDVTVTASGVRSPFYSHSGEDVEGESPWATSSMSTGGVTHSLTSVYWPGDTGGHGGDTLYLLGAPCILENPQGVLPVDPPCLYQPPQPPPSAYQPLNDSYKAEAQSGSGKGVSDNKNQGVTMHAAAHDTSAIATTTMGGSIDPSTGSQFGKTSVMTKIQDVGPKTVVIDSTSILHNVSIGGGAITIDSITSVAHAVSNTVSATGTASTTVSGMKIGGVPVTVDNKGIHIAGQGGSLPGTDQLNTALAQSGFKVFVAQPTKTVNGPAIQVDSGNLVLMQVNPQYMSNANDSGRMIVLGGAAIDANTGKGFNFNYTPPPPTSTNTGGSTGGTAGTPGTPGTAGTPGTPGLPASSGTTTSGTTPGAPPQLAAKSLALPTSSSPATWIVLCMLGAGLLAFGMRRLPDEVLASGGTGCVLGETT